MTAIRWYLDEDAMHHALVAALRARQVDVLTVFEAGMVGESDDVQLVFAIQQGRTLYSFNVGDFCRLHGEYLAAGKAHAGIVVVPHQRHSVGEQARRLLQLGETRTAEEVASELIFL